jgi:hypothetical protein
VILGRTNWIAFKQGFFTVAMISDKGFSASGSEVAILPLPDSTHTKQYSAKLFFDLERKTISLAVFSATIQLKVEGKNMPVRQQVTTRLVSMKPTAAP